MSNIFEQATRQELRFNIGNITITTEQLWRSTLKQLDTIAIDLHKRVNDSTPVSFTSSVTKTTANREDELKFAVVKHVIEVLLKEKSDAKESAQLDARRKFLIEVINEKKRDQVKNSDLATLEAELAKLV